MQVLEINLTRKAPRGQRRINLKIASDGLDRHVTLGGILWLLAVVNETEWTKGPTSDICEPLDEICHLAPDGLVQVRHDKEEQDLLGMVGRDCCNRHRRSHRSSSQS